MLFTCTLIAIAALTILVALPTADSTAKNDNANALENALIQAATNDAQATAYENMLIAARQDDVGQEAELAMNATNTEIAANSEMRSGDVLVAGTRPMANVTFAPYCYTDAIASNTTFFAAGATVGLLGPPTSSFVSRDARQRIATSMENPGNAIVCAPAQLAV